MKWARNEFCTPKGEGSIPEVEIRNKSEKIFCSLYDEILNYDISDFDLQDRTLALRSANRELYHFATRYTTYLLEIWNKL